MCSLIKVNNDEYFSVSDNIHDNIHNNIHNISNISCINTKDDLNKKCEKAGVIIYDSSNQYIMLVRNKVTQTYGFPKGSKENNESSLDTAIREVYEETSFFLNKDLVQPYGIIANTYYFFTYLPFNFIDNIDSNSIDVNEIDHVTWVSISYLKCLKHYKNTDLKNFNYHVKQYL